jgi:hypothetical protein
MKNYIFKIIRILFYIFTSDKRPAKKYNNTKNFNYYARLANYQSEKGWIVGFDGLKMIDSLIQDYLIQKINIITKSPSRVIQLQKSVREKNQYIYQMRMKKKNNTSYSRDDYEIESVLNIHEFKNLKIVKKKQNLILINSNVINDRKKLKDIYIKYSASEVFIFFASVYNIKTDSKIRLLSQFMIDNDYNLFKIQRTSRFALHGYLGFIFIKNNGKIDNTIFPLPFKSSDCFKSDKNTNQE